MLARTGKASSSRRDYSRARDPNGDAPKKCIYCHDSAFWGWLNWSDGRKWRAGLKEEAVFVAEVW